jgi:hypothetical protein
VNDAPEAPDRWGVQIWRPKSKPPSGEVANARRGRPPIMDFRPLSAVLGEEIRRRLRDRADPVDKPAAYQDEHRVWIPTDYSVAAGIGEVPGGHLHKSSAAFHAKMGARPEQANVTGGMWAGLGVLGPPTACELKFRNRSVGQQGTWRPPFKDGTQKRQTSANRKRAIETAEASEAEAEVLRLDRTGTRQERSRRAMAASGLELIAKVARKEAAARSTLKAIKINNSTKAWATASSLGWSPLKTREAETNSMAGALECIIAATLEGVEWTRIDPVGDPGIVNRMVYAAASHRSDLLTERGQV